MSSWWVTAVYKAPDRQVREVNWKGQYTNVSQTLRRPGKGMCFHFRVNALNSAEAIEHAKSSGYFGGVVDWFDFFAIQLDESL